MGEPDKGGVAHTPSPWLFSNRSYPPALCVGGCPGYPSPRLDKRDPPHPFLRRVPMPTPRRSMGPEMPGNNARFPFVERGVSGIPPPHGMQQTDHTPPPPGRGGIPDTPLLRPEIVGNRKLPGDRMGGVLPRGEIVWRLVGVGTQGRGVYRRPPPSLQWPCPGGDACPVREPLPAHVRVHAPARNADGSLLTGNPHEHAGT
jgi:hypothetical protein